MVLQITKRKNAKKVLKNENLTTQALMDYPGNNSSVGKLSHGLVHAFKIHTY
jgi:hypothetical protein